LTIRRDGESVSLLDGDAVVVTATPTAVEVDVVVPNSVAFSDAEAASRAYPGFRDHVFPRCFACGPARTVGDGLRIFPGPVPGHDLVAAPWIPDGSLADNVGDVRPELLWAVLDCPSGWASSSTATPMLLGEMAARLLGPVRVGERCVVLGWVLGREGRKRFAGAAILGEDSAPRALAHATWIAIASR
jgi:hypothetical protein